MDAELWYRLDARDDDPAFFYPNFAAVPALSAPGRDPPPVFPQRRNAGRAGPARCLPCPTAIFDRFFHRAGWVDLPADGAA